MKVSEVNHNGWDMADLMKFTAGVIVMVILATSMCSCRALPTSARAIEAGGDVEASMDEEESSVDVAGSTGDVSTVRYGLDDATKELLMKLPELVSEAFMSGVLLFSKVMGSIILIGIGAFVLAYFSKPPSGSGIPRWGVVVGLATLIGGPAALWILL